jgi:REP element-mobilizing transposase RayT
MPYARKDTTQWLPGHYYHIYNRGAQKATLFREEDNYFYVLRKAKKYCREFQLSMIAYCLMPNHYHFLVRQDGEQRAGLLPQRIFNGYTKAYNARYGHSGTLFERRYQVKRIESQAHLLHLCRYIHANPVKDGLVSGPGDWPYSNYLEWIVGRDGKLVDPEFIAANFQSIGDYIAFVDDYLQTRSLPADVKDHLVDLER